jgi:nucleoid-associated protein YgaU
MALSIGQVHGAHNRAANQSRVIVPVVLGPKIMPGYRNYLEHVVESGETLWGISTVYYGSGNLYYRLVSANPHTISNPNLIHPGDIVRVPRD